MNLASQRFPLAGFCRRLAFALSWVGAIASGAESGLQHRPADELASLRVLDGFEVNLFASEDQGVIKPIQIRFDVKGRLWVAGSTVYPQIQPGQIPNDKIVVLEDSDGDGVADRSTVFADGLMIPTGLELGDGGLYVGQGNELLFLKDTDGDGKSDERRVVLRGFGTGDAHQTVNSFTWSPGGELFMCQGLHAFSRVETPWGLETLEQAGVMRLQPRRLRLDPFLNQAMGPQNPFGVAFNQWGQPLLVAGNGEGIYFLKPGMTRSHERHAMNALWNTGRKFGGADFVENSHWPTENQGELITGSYLNNAVYRFKVSEQGSGYSVKDLPPLITTTNISFRVVDARFGPDGALYLCDWYNPIIGHYQASFRHPDRDKQHGRIWRVTAKGRPLVARPKLTEADLSNLCEALFSSERWARQMAKRELVNREAQGSAAFVREWRRRVEGTRPGFELALVEGLGVLESMETVDPEWLNALLGAKDPRARAYAVSVLGRWSDRLPDPLVQLKAAVRDPDSRVRLDAAVAASFFKHPQAVVEVLQLVKQPMDDFLDYALKQAIRVMKPVWLEPLRQHQLEFGGNFEGLEFLVKADRTADTSGFVLDRLRDPKLPRPAREALLSILSEVGDASQLAFLLDDPTAYRVGEKTDPELMAKGLSLLVTAARSRGLRPNIDLESAIRQRQAVSDPELRAQWLRLIGAWRLMNFRSTLQQIGSDDASAPVVRVAAIQGVGYLAGAESERWLSGFTAGSTALVLESMDALASLNLRLAATNAASFLSVARDSRDTERCFGLFLARRDGAEALRMALDGKLSSIPAEVGRIGLNVMNGTGRYHEALSATLAKLTHRQVQATTWTPAEIGLLAEEAKRSGDPIHGESIYKSAQLNCVSCHALNGVGGKVGPDLGSLGTAQPTDFMVGAILNPQKEVKEGFTAYRVTTQSGDEYQGYLVRETAEEIVIRDTLQNEEVRLSRGQVAERRKIGSLMPPGLVDGLSREDFRDLVRFLSGLGRL